MSQLVTLEDCGPYGCVTLNDPGKRNALTRELQRELQDVLRETVGRYPVMILTGAGPYFCGEAGREDVTSAAGREFSRQGHSISETLELVRKHPAVFIAAVNGDAVGDGVALVNVCDLAIAAEEASLVIPDIARAAYSTGAGPSTQLRILRKHASWMILTGKRVDARTAARWGLVNLAVPGDRVLTEARAVAEKIAAFNPVTLDWTKKALDDVPGHVSDWTAALEYGRVITAVVQNQIGKENFMPKKF